MIEQARFRDWKEIGPRFTSDNAKTLKLEVKDEIRIEIGVKLDKMAAQLEGVREDVTELKQHLKQ